ncbi:ABC transporter permease [Halosolutus gelatinilyticus]|uniref:ABC transporter permease n=1 Tax=Halosolutus gelatinilyticus TaxID=2931975 RepID=UPI001FF23C01|nr:ABC transporter permease [Halosolutus gelatinilyticus]
MAIDTTTADSTAGGATPAWIWLTQVRAFTERCLREVRNSWTMLSVVLALPAGMQLLFGMQSEDVPAELVAAMAIGTGTFGAMYICLYIFGYQLAGDLADRRYEAYRSMPLFPSADLAGRMLSGLVLAGVAFVLTLAAGVYTGASFGLRGPASIPIVLLAFVVTCAFWMIVAMPFILYAQNERVAEYAVPMLAIVGYIGTGINGASVELSPIEGEVLNYLPNTLPTRLLVYHLVPGDAWTDAGVVPPALPTGPEYIVLLVAYGALALAVGTVLLTAVLYRRGWRP